MRHLMTGAALAALAIGLAGTAHAQEGEPETASLDLDVVVVKGFRGSLASALLDKQSAVGVVDSIRAESIGKFPDLNVSESLQRITGVTINRTVTGEGDTVSLRGLPPEYTQVTLNGMIAASGNDGREFDFDVFASELFSGAKVYKTPSAEMTEGGLAGTIDLSTPAPFDFDSNQFLLSVGGQYADMGRGDATPRTSGLASWTNGDGTFGVLASASYSESTIRNDTRQGFRYQPLSSASGLGALVKQQVASGGTIPTVNVNGVDINNPDELLALADRVAFPMLPRVGVDIVDLERLGLTGAVQYRPSASIDMSLNVLYAQFDREEERHTIDAALGYSGKGATNAIPTSLTTRMSNATEYAVAGAFDGVSQRSETVDDVTETGFLQINSDNTFQMSDNLQAKASFGYSSAEADDLYRSYLYDNVGSVTYDLSDPEWPKFQGIGFDYLDASVYKPNQIRLRPTNISDKAYHGRADLIWELAESGLSRIKAGLEGDRRKKENEAFNYLTLSSSVPFSAVASPLFQLVSDYNDGAPAGVPGNFLGVDINKGRELLLPGSVVSANTPNLVGSWTVTEEVLSGYVQSDWAFDIAGAPAALDFGVRVADTSQTSDGHRKVGNNFDPVSVENQYTDVLPSLNLRVTLPRDVIARVSLNKAITRPTLSQLSAGTTINSTNNLTASSGNPELKPYRANQIDGSLEWYFAPESLVAVTGFYKDMESFIVSSQEQRVIEGPNLINDASENVSGETFTVTLPVNGTGGELYGVEISYQQPLSFLPAPFDGLGILANATLSESSGETVQGGRTLTQPLQGQSDLSYNLIGYYEKGPISLRAAYSYRGDYIGQFRSDVWTSGVPHTLFVDSRGQLDLAMRYDLTKAIQLYVDVINATGTDYYSYDTVPGMSRDYFAQGPVYNFGLRASF